MKTTFICTTSVTTLILILCIAINYCFPNAESDSDISEKEIIASYIEENNSLEPEDYHKAVVSISQKNDIGLELYRSMQTRAAVVFFYTNVTGNADVAMAILEHADKNSIPLSLAFSLAYTESTYKPTAVNTNTNESIDRGLFQLNDKSFPNLTESDFFDPYISAKYGMSHLKFCIETAGNEIAGLAMYNAGSNKVRKNNTPQRTLNYVSKIMNYREGLDAIFRVQVAEKFPTEKNASYLAYNKL